MIFTEDRAFAFIADFLNMLLQVPMGGETVPFKTVGFWQFSKSGKERSDSSLASHGPPFKSMLLSLLDGEIAVVQDKPFNRQALMHNGTAISWIVMSSPPSPAMQTVRLLPPPNQAPTAAGRAFHPMEARVAIGEHPSSFTRNA